MSVNSVFTPHICSAAECNQCKTEHAISKLKFENIQDVAAWSGKKFGELRGYRKIAEDIRILSHTKGFAVFFPENFWRKLDAQVMVSFPENENAECWIAGKKFAFLKVDVDSSVVEGADKDYVSSNLQTALDKIEKFVKINFFENTQAYPESSYFTHGSYKDHPEMLRPFRLRLGGNFRFQL